MRRRHSILLGLCLIAITAGALYRLGEVPADPLPAPVEQKVEPDTTGVYRLLARFNPGMAKALTVEVYRTADRFDLIPEVLAGLICTESSAQPTAKNGSCLGLGQVHWKVWSKELKARGVAAIATDLHDPHRGLTASALILRHYLNQTGSIRLALKKYSGGAGRWYADRVLAYASEAGLSGAAMIRPLTPENAKLEECWEPGHCRTCLNWAKDGDPIWRYCKARQGRTWVWERCEEYRD